MQASKTMLRERNALAGFSDDEKMRWARDCAAVILHAAVTGEVAGESGDFGASLPCPQCHGDGQVGMHRDGQPIVCDQCRGSGMPR